MILYCFASSGWTHYIFSNLHLQILLFKKKDRSSDRRYEFIETTDTNDHSTYKLQYGQKKSCANELMYQSWEKGSDVGAHCDVCLCTCEDTQLQTDRYFSLNDAISDTYENL